jgi:cytochrome oxidase Cu insertion factor (SCO1/SenC/PrrC family)
VIRVLILAVLVGVAALIGVLHVAAVGPDPTSEADLWRAAGIARAARQVPAPSFQLQDLVGNRVDLRQLRGRIVLVYFWGSW